MKHILPDSHVTIVSSLAFSSWLSPSAHAFSDGSFKVLSRFSHYILFLWGNFIHIVTPIITNMLMTSNPVCSIQITRLSSRFTNPTASSDISAWMTEGTKIILFKTKIIFLYSIYSSSYYTYLSNRNHQLFSCLSQIPGNLTL